MASFNTQDFGFDEPPPRPTTPPVRRGFLLVLSVLSLAALVVYGVPYVAERTSYSWESGRARADSEALAKLDKAGIVNRASDLFRMASSAVSPAVVNVHSFRLRRGGEGFQGLPLGGNRWNPRLQDAELGSGVIIDKVKGYIVTNNHVVQNADRISVRHGTDELPARLVGADPKTDLAVLQVNAALQVQAEWGDSDQLDIGSWVLAIGSPLGFDHSVTAGIVSATERNDVQLSEYETYIQTDAAINPGNSGGPLINLAGKVVGINTAIISLTGGYEGIGLAIPSALAKRVVEGLIKEGKVVRGYLGVMTYPLNVQLARTLKIPNSQGALIGDVQPGSPADRAGLRRGDVIVKIADREVVNFASLRNLTASLDVGSEVSVTYYRDGKAQTAEVTIAELPPAPEILGSLGFGVHERSAPGDGAGSFLEIDKVVAGGPAFQAGLRPGMRILAVGERKEPVSTLSQFEVAVRKLGPERRVSLLVQSNDGRNWFLQIGNGTNGRANNQR
jgi:serine protease Do